MKKVKKLVSAETAGAIDRAAATEWGLNPFGLVEAAGRNAAARFFAAYPALFEGSLRVAVAVGSGNNGADAMVMLRVLILAGKVRAEPSFLVLSRLPVDARHGGQNRSGLQTPHSEAFRSLVKMGVRVFEWDGQNRFQSANLVIDGITGTGIRGQLEGKAAEMAAALNAAGNAAVGAGSVAINTAFAIAAANVAAPITRDVRPPEKRPTENLPFVVSVDVPSGCFDLWKPGMPIVRADATLAIEPQKLCLYKSAARSFAGKILSVDCIFPDALVASFQGAELLNQDAPGLEPDRSKSGDARPPCVNSRELGSAISPSEGLMAALKRLPKIKADAYKSERGIVSIRAGSVGFSGAARIAAAGAAAAGAGMVRLTVDGAIYPIVAASCGGGIIVSPATEAADGTFPPEQPPFAHWAHPVDRHPPEQPLFANIARPVDAARLPSAPPFANGARPVDTARLSALPLFANTARPVDTAHSADTVHPIDAILLGPGWGTDAKRLPVLQAALRLEAEGTPLILDADAITLAKDAVFHGMAILTPHPGEFARFAGVSKEEALADPVPLAGRIAGERRAAIVFKSHVLVIAAEDGRVGIIDGMAPVLAAGGSGDLLAGICAGIAARARAVCRARNAAFDPYNCACAAASLLIAAGKSSRAFLDPLELAGIVARLAAEAWL